MKRSKKQTPSSPTKQLESIGLATLVLWLGLQIFHVYLPGVIDYLTTYFGPEQQALYALATFAMVLFVPLAYRLLGERGLLILTAVGIALIRLAIQFVESQSVGLILSTIGVISIQDGQLSV